MKKNRRFVFWLIVMLISNLMACWMYSTIRYILMGAAFTICQICAVYEMFKLVGINDRKSVVWIDWRPMVCLIISAYLLFFLKPVDKLNDFIIFIAGMLILTIALFTTKDTALLNRKGTKNEHI